MQTPKWTTFDGAVSRSKFEIVVDVMLGVVPTEVASFAELRKYVESNRYGGALDHEEVEGEADFWIAVRGAVDAWIRTGVTGGA